MSEQIFNNKIAIPQIQMIQQKNDSQQKQQQVDNNQKIEVRLIQEKKQTQNTSQKQEQNEECPKDQIDTKYFLSQFIQEQLNNLNAEKDSKKNNQLSNENQKSACQSRECIDSNINNQGKVSSQAYMDQSQSSESNSSSCPMQKLKNQIFNMNLSSSSEQLQEEISPKNDSTVKTRNQSLWPISNQINCQENNLCFLKSNQHNNTTNSNKFHFNKENYLDIFVSEQEQQNSNNDDQLNVQQTIEKYNSFTQSNMQQGVKRESAIEQKPYLQSVSSQLSSSQDLLSVIFCQNSQQLPFSLNIPQSITKYLPKQSSISTEKLDTFGGLEKSINEKFINSRKNSASQNSSDNLTAHFNNEYSNQHTSTCSSSSSNTQKCANTNKVIAQCSGNFIKKPSPTSVNQMNIQPLSISNQQNVVKSPKAVWKNCEQKQNSQQLPTPKPTFEQSSLQCQKTNSNIQNDSILTNLSNQSLSQITNLISQAQLISNTPLPSQAAANLNQQNIFSNPCNSSINSSNKKNRICNCKKTKCLKLYCDCFAVGELCGSDCKCVECCNNEASLHLRNQAIEGILQRNPFAFNVKPEEAKKSKKELNSSVLQNSNSKVIGCNCRKSNCLKKYCLCYHSGIKCSEACKCTECKNLENGLNSSSHSLCSSSIQYQSNQNNNQILLTHQQKQQFNQNLYNQNLSSSVKKKLQENNNINENFIPIQQIIENLALAAQQTQLQSNNFNRLLQSQGADDENEDDNVLEGQENEENEPIQSQQQKVLKNQPLNQYNNLFLNAISQFNLNLQDNPHHQGEILGSSPTFSNLQQQSMRKKLFLNDSGQTTPVSPGGLPIQNQQSHLNMQNINNLFSLIKNISSADQYQ